MTFFELPAEYARIQQCSARIDCAGAGHNAETKELAGYALQNWLWTGATNKIFSVAEQDALIAMARSRAAAAQPASTQIVEIGFFTDIIAHQSGTQHYLGARASYSGCLTVPNPD